MVYPPGQAVDEKTRATGFGGRLRLQQRDGPVALFALQRSDLRSHLIEQGLIAGAAGMVHRQVVENPREACEHPAIAATPENLAVCRIAPGNEAAVAEI